MQITIAFLEIPSQLCIQLKSINMHLDLTTEDRSYRFTLYPLDTKFYQVAGIYTFFIIPFNFFNESSLPFGEVRWGSYSLLYAGITNNFRGRFNQHHKIKKAIALGMTHIGILKITSARKRKKIERQILQHHHPPLNQTWLNDIPPNSPSKSLSRT